ncbi:hypothetical protein CVT25_004986 [Psilocybe cyanescens]|uniref:Uncharacterized protein n=1 Tax=Psilocybe cyanescens TaxID=93625 RepID=A0A409X275_PSICY|nr:hypothetical protein CVT25_004986 [Psilocybe cyanescens]
MQNRKYSYTWDDYPLEVPITLKQSTEVTVEESVHYHVVGEEAHDEWIYDSPHGEGTFRLGPNRQYSTISMFHQLHCLRIFRGAIASGPDYPMKLQRQHLEHCLNYLREMTLCSADLTLEPGDFTQRDFDLHRTGATHMCRDYRELYRLTENDWVECLHFDIADNVEALTRRDIG